MRNAECGIKKASPIFGEDAPFLKGNGSMRIYLASKVSQQVSLQVDASP